MDPETEKIIKEQMENLPEEIKNLFADPSVGEKILNIGKKNGIINIQQLGEFQLETNLMMLGLVHPDEYPNELKERLKISSETVNNIINDINDQILNGIREKLKEVYEKTDTMRKESFEDEGEEEINSNKEETLENREKLLEEIENVDLTAQKELETPVKTETPPILSQKLSGSFQIPKVETEHTITNITKDTDTSIKPKGNIPKIDPYREIPS